MKSYLLDQLAVLRALVLYWVAVRPRVAHELRRWQRRAEAIPDATLRAQALSTLRDEGFNSEGAAVFATLVPSSQVTRAACLFVRLQMICDYVDTVSEQADSDPLRNTHQLHLALIDALQPGLPTADYYRHNPDEDDGGYLLRLVQACRNSLEKLPSYPEVREAAVHAVKRCVEGQSFTLAAIHQGTDRLSAWALEQDGADGYRWWEVAAASLSTVSLYALLALAANRDVTTAEAIQTDSVYFPSFCAVNALLDSLVDFDEDLRQPSLSSISRYNSSAEAGKRLSYLFCKADAAARGLRFGRRHAAMLVGISGFYLSTPNAENSFVPPIKAALAQAVGSRATMMLATLRLRRRLG